MTKTDELLFLPLGGSGEIGMNVNLYGHKGKWVMVDLGMTFADPSLPGVDLVLPDLKFIEDRRDDLLGIVLTHGHEDHIGAIPYLAAELGVTLYATPFTAGLIRHKLQEEGIEREVKLKTIPMGGSFKLGPFGFRYVHLAHSIPEGNALVIETPHGRIFHTGDWKLDDAPVIGKPSTAEQLGAIGDDGILAYVGDSTNVFNDEASGSETGVRDSLLNICAKRKGRIIITTFASNVARLSSLGEVAMATGRKLVLAGRSMERITRVARETGYLKNFPPVVALEEADRLKPQETMIVCTGCQGEPQAALSRIAQGAHPAVKLSRGDLAIFSSKNIPGNGVAIAQVQNALVMQGIEVITEKEAHVHVSGHPGRPELAAMIGWIKPQIVIPVHGEARHMHAHAAFARSLGIAQAVVPTNGAIIRLAPGPATIIDHAPVGRWVLDGDVMVPSDGRTMIERRRLLNHGYIAVTLCARKRGGLAADPILFLQGVPVEEERESFLADLQDAAVNAYAQARDMDDDKIIEHVRIAIRRLARDYTGKKPVVDVQLTTVA